MKRFAKRKPLLSVLLGLFVALFAWTGLCSVLGISAEKTPIFSLAEETGETVDETTPTVTFDVPNTEQGYTITYAVLDETSVSVKKFVKSTSSTNIELLKLPTSVVYPADGKEYAVCAIGEYAFGSTVGNDGSIAVETVDLSATSIKVIGDNAFKGNGVVRSVLLPSALVKIGANAFLGCSALTTIKLPDSLTELGEGAFRESGLKEIEIPENLKEISPYAFYKVGIRFINLKNVERVGESAFHESGLVTVRTGSGLTYAGKNAFNNTNLKYFDIGFKKPDEKWAENVFNANNEIFLLKDEYIEDWDGYCGLSETGVWVNDLNDVTWKFESITAIDILDVPSADMKIEKVVSEGKEITDSHGLKFRFYDGGTGVYAFVSAFDMQTWNKNCIDFVVPQKVLYDEKEYPVKKIAIGNAAENGVIYSVYIGEGIESVTENSFAACQNLKDIYVKEPNVTVLNDSGANVELADAWTEKRIVLNYGSEAALFNAEHIFVNYELTDLKDGQGVRYYLDETYGYAVVGDVAAGDDVNANTSKYVGSGYYSGKTGYAVIPDFVSQGNEYYKVVGIGRYAFYNSETLVGIELGAFVGSGIDQAKIDTGEKDENGDTIYVEGVFDGSGNLVEAGVSDCAFRNCEYLISFAVDGRNEVYTTDGALLMEKGLTGEKRSEHPVKIVKAGKNVTSYGKTHDSFDKISTVENYAFANCTKLVSFDFSVIELIGEHAFENAALTAIDFTAGDDAGLVSVSVGDYAFANNYAVTKVWIGEGDKLGRFVFWNCYSVQAFASNSTKYLVENDVLYEAFDTYAVLLQYPASKTGVSSFTVESCQGLPVTEIEGYAFGYSALTEIVVSENVLFIGKAAFSDCSKLLNATIGKNVAAIGIEIKTTTGEDTDAYYTQSYKFNTFEREKWEIYEREAFDGCNVLSGVKVDKDNEYYLSDNNGILYNKDKTILFMYAPGITRVSYTVPNSVTKIGIEAFEENVHLQRLILNEGVTEVGAKAFNGCTKLYSIYFRSLMAPAIGEQVFNSTGALVKDGLHVYCIPEPGVWLSERAELWGDNAELVEQYVAIQEVPDQAQPTAQVYLIYVMDSDGNYLPGMKVTFGYEGLNGDAENSVEKTLYVNDSGYAVLTLPADISRLYDGDRISLIVEDEEKVYYTYSALIDYKDGEWKGGYYLDLSLGFSYITLRSIPTIEGISCDGRDIATGKVAINTISKIEEEEGIETVENVEIWTSAQWDSAATFKEMALYLVMERNGVWTEKMVSTEAITVAPSDRFFRFEINPRDVAQGEGVTEYYYEARLTVELDGVEKTVEKKLNVDLFYADINGLSSSFKLDQTVGFTIPSNVPLVGGVEFEFSIYSGKSPLLVESYGDKVYVGINFVDKSWDLTKTAEERKKDEENRKKMDFFDLLEEQLDEKIEALEKSLSGQGGKSKTLSLEVTGGVELEKKTLNADLQVMRGTIKGYLKYEFEYDAPIVWVWWIPIQFEVELSSELKLTLSMNVDHLREGGSFWESFEGGLDFSVGVEVRGGIGCSIVSIGIYGSATLDFVLSLSKEVGGIDGGITLDVGFYAKLDLGIIKWKKKYSWVDGGKQVVPFKCEFWSADPEAEPAALWSFDDGENAVQFASFTEAVTYALSTTDTAFSKFEGTYENYGGAEAKIVSYDGSYYKFYIDNAWLNGNIVNKEGIGLNEYNYLKLVYQKMKEDGTWNAPIIVNEDIHNETDFDVCVDENGIHILYRRVNTQVTAENAANYVSLLDVYQTTYKNGTFTSPVKLSSTSAYKSDLEISSVDGALYAAWVENADNNVFGMSNDNVYDEAAKEYIVYETTANSVWVVVFDGAGQVSNTLKVNDLTTVADIAFVKTGKATLLVALDEDCDVSTVADRTLWTVDLGASSGSLKSVALVDENGNAILSMTAIRYENGTVYVQSDGLLYACDYTNGKLVASECASNVYSGFDFIYDGSGNLYGLGFIVNDSEEVANLYVAPYVDGAFVNAVKITNLTDGMVENFATYALSDGIKLIYLQSNKVEGVEETEDVVSTYVALERPLDKTSDLVLEKATYNVNAIKVGSAFGMDILLFNDSLRMLDAVKVVLTNAEGAEVFETELTGLALLPGERRTIAVEINAIEAEKFTASYTLTVSAVDEGYAADENDKKQVTLGYADLEVTAKYVEIAEVKYFLVMVQNVGTMPVDGFTLFVENGIVFADEETHEYLYELTGEYALASGEYKYFTIELNKVYFTEEYVTVTVKTGSAEYNLSNNLMSYSMEKNEAVNFGVTYTITYNVDGKIVGSEQRKAGETVEMLVLPEKEGYTFSGWSYNFTKMPAYDISVYGSYAKNRYLVEYYVDGDEKPAFADEFEFGSIVSVRAPEYKEGYSFNGWYLDEGLENKYVATTMPVDGVSLYGKYTIESYDVLYYLDGEAYYVDGKPYVQTYEYGANVTLPKIEKEGYDFKGWSKADGFTMPAYHVYVYGSTQIKTYEVSYVVETDEESEPVRTVTVTHGSTLEIYNYFVPEGYAFDGWYLDEAYTQKVEASSNKKVTASLVLYGKNTEKTYFVNYYVNGEKVRTQEVAYKAEIPEYVYESEGYEFAGWQDLPETMPAYNLNVYGAANEILYSVSYYVDGKEQAEFVEEYPVGANVALRDAPDKEGYSFGGWYADEGLTDKFTTTVMPTQNISVYGAYIVNSYEIRYYVNSVCKKTQTYEYGAIVTAYEYTPPTGYNFLGFEGVPESMPAYDLNVYGKTEIRTFTLTYLVDGTAVRTESVPYGGAIVAYEYQPPVGKAVSAWSGLPQTMPAENVSVTATTSLRSFNLNYYVDGALVKTDVYEYGAAVTEYAYEAAKGKEFLGFDGVPETMPANDVNAYGTTTNILYRLNYYVDDTLIFTDLYPYDAVIAVRENYRQYGYTFSGWGDVARRMPDHDVDARGTLTKNSHNVYYYIGEELLYTDAYLYGDSVVVRGAESKEGHTFSGWTGAPSVMQDEDVIVTASFTKNEYEVSYYVNGTFYKTEKVAYGEAVDLGGFETDEYSVVGWTKDGEAVTELTQGAANMRLDAKVQAKEKSLKQNSIFVGGVSALGGGGLASGVWALVQLVRKKRRLGRLNRD